MSLDPLCGLAYPCLAAVPWWKAVATVAWELIPAAGFTYAGVLLGHMFAVNVIWRDW